MSIPLLVYTDAPDHQTGLARICRELVSQIHACCPDYRVATLGVFGRGSSRFPWTQYTANGPDDALYNLEQICTDFFGTDRGILLTITPPSWLFALTLPQYMEKEPDPRWKAFTTWMATKPFDLWSYLAIESHGPLGQYGPTTRAILSMIDRRLYYSRWGAELSVASSIDLDGKAAFIHHGIDCETWKPSPPETVRKFRAELGVNPADLLLGCVATNTRRKLLPLLFESAYIMRHQLGSARLKLWLNTTGAMGEYNVNELAACFGFNMDSDILITSTNARRPDGWLANMYSACDLTCLPTAGEGFGYPVVESLACGTPCVTCSFGAQAEFLSGWRDAWICPTAATHLVSNTTLVEPVYDAQTFANRLLTSWTELRHRGTLLREDCRTRAMIWDWSNIWPHWAEWFANGIAQPKLEVSANGPPRVPKLKACADSSFVPAHPPDSPSLGSAVGADPVAAGQRAADDPPGGLDSGAPVGVAGETDAP